MTNHSRVQLLGLITFTVSILMLPLTFTVSGGDSGSYFPLLALLYSCFCGVSLLVIPAFQPKMKWPYAAAALCYLGGVYHYGKFLFSVGDSGVLMNATLVVSSLTGLGVNLLALMMLFFAAIDDGEKKSLSLTPSKFVSQSFGLLALLTSVQVYDLVKTTYEQSGTMYVISSFLLSLAIVIVGLLAFLRILSPAMLALLGPLVAAQILCQTSGNPGIEEIWGLLTSFGGLSNFPLYSFVAALCLGALGTCWFLALNVACEQGVLEKARSSKR